MKKIPVGNNKFALIDDEDYELVMNKPYIKYQKSKFNQWRITKSKHIEYAGCPWRNSKAKFTTMRMHRLILKLAMNDDIIVDHRDGNGLNNQKYNLRICSQSNNLMNQHKLRGGSSKYKGVFWSNRHNKWIARINKKHIGHFINEKDAAIAYNKKALIIFGEFACLNQI